MGLVEKIRTKTYNTLRRSEKYTQTDMVYLAKGGTWLNLNTIVNNALLLLLAITFANFLSKEIYGIYKYVISVGSILLAANLPGLATSITRSVARGYEKIIIQGYLARIKWGFLSSLAAAALGIYYLEMNNPLLGKAFFISAAFLPFVQSANIFSGYLIGKTKFKECTQYNLIAAAAYALPMIAVVYLTNNLFLIILTYFAGQTIVNTALLFHAIKKFKPNQKKDPQALSFGKHLSLMAVINSLASYLDRILVFHFAGAAETAIYSFAVAVPDQFKGFFYPIESLAMPKWSRAKSSDIKISIKRKLLQLLAAVTILIGVYYLSAPLIYKTFFPQYMDSVFLSQIYIFSFLNIVPTFVVTALQAKAKVKALYVFSIINPLLQIALIIIMGMAWGVLGVILARVSSRLLSSFFALFFYKKI